MSLVHQSRFFPHLIQGVGRHRAGFFCAMFEMFAYGIGIGQQFLAFFGVRGEKVAHRFKQLLLDIPIAQARSQITLAQACYPVTVEEQPVDLEDVAAVSGFFAASTGVGSVTMRMICLRSAFLPEEDR